MVFHQNRVKSVLTMVYGPCKAKGPLLTSFLTSSPSIPVLRHTTRDLPRVHTGSSHSCPSPPHRGVGRKTPPDHAAHNIITHCPAYPATLLFYTALTTISNYLIYFCVYMVIFCLVTLECKLHEGGMRGRHV